MAWVEAHLEEKLASAGSNSKVQSAGPGLCQSTQRHRGRERPMRNADRLRKLPKLLEWD
jgi:hypothetical protein